MEKEVPAFNCYVVEKHGYAPINRHGSSPRSYIAVTTHLFTEFGNVWQKIGGEELQYTELPLRKHLLRTISSALTLHS